MCCAAIRQFMSLYFCIQISALPRFTPTLCRSTYRVSETAIPDAGLTPLANHRRPLPTTFCEARLRTGPFYTFPEHSPTSLLGLGLVPHFLDLGLCLTRYAARYSTGSSGLRTTHGYLVKAFSIRVSVSPSP